MDSKIGCLRSKAPRRQMAYSSPGWSASYCIVQTIPEVTILLLQSTKFWNYKHIPPFISV